MTYVKLSYFKSLLPYQLKENQFIQALLIMLLGQINLPLIIGTTITPFYKVTILMNID